MQVYLKGRDMMRCPSNSIYAALQNPAATITFGPKSTAVPYIRMHISSSEPMVLEQHVDVLRD